MPASFYLIQNLVDHFARASESGPAFARPASVYVALFNQPPSAAGGGTEVSTSGTNYGRAQLHLGQTNATGTAVNSADVVFPSATADWGLVKAFGVFDATTAGKLLWYGNLTTERPIHNGDAVRFPAGQFSLTGT